MAEKLLNNFLLGADPELVVLDPPTLVNAQKRRAANTGFYGFDHNGWVVEPHPAPSFSARTVCANIKKSLDVMSHHYLDYRLRAGAYYNDPNNRSVTLGGHVHLDMPSLSMQQIDGMDVLCESLQGLDILPAAECVTRSAQGDYGGKADIRAERGRVEYRRMCSWLFSRKTSMLCMTGIKLAAVAPQTLKRMTSVAQLQAWFEGFKGLDDDVDWILDRNYFGTSMEAKPDANVKAVWRVDPDKAKEWMAEDEAKIAQTQNETRQTLQGPIDVARDLTVIRAAQTETRRRMGRDIEMAGRAAVEANTPPRWRATLDNNNFNF